MLADLLVLQQQAAQRIAFVGVETGRDQDQVGLEGVKRREDARQHGVAEHVAAIATARGKDEQE